MTRFSEFFVNHRDIKVIMHIWLLSDIFIYEHYSAIWMCPIDTDLDDTSNGGSQSGVGFLF